MTSQFRITKVKNIALILVAILIPVGNPRWSGMSVIIITLLWLIEGDFRLKLTRLKSNPVLIAFILLFLLYPISLLYTEHQLNGLFNVEKHLAFLFLPLVIFTSELNEKNVRYAMNAFIYTGTFLMFFCILVAMHDYLVTGNIEVQIGQNISNKFLYYGLVRAIPGWHPIYIAMIMNLSVIFYLNKIVKNWKNIPISYKVLLGSAILFSVISILLLNALSGILTLIFIGILSMIYFILKVGKKRLLIAGLILVAGSSAAILSFNRPFREKISAVFTDKLEPTDDAGKRNALSIRLAKWDAGLLVVRENPLFGVGPGDAKYELYKAYQKKKYLYLAEMQYNAHNQYFEFLIAFGLVGFSIYLFIIFHCGVIAVRRRDLLLMSCIIILILAGFSESILDRQQGVLFFSFLVPLILKRNTSNDKAQQ